MTQSCGADGRVPLFRLREMTHNSSSRKAERVNITAAKEAGRVCLAVLDSVAVVRAVVGTVSAAAVAVRLAERAISVSVGTLAKDRLLKCMTTSEWKTFERV